MQRVFTILAKRKYTAVQQSRQPTSLSNWDTCHKVEFVCRRYPKEVGVDSDWFAWPRKDSLDHLLLGHVVPGSRHWRYFCANRGLKNLEILEVNIPRSSKGQIMTIIHHTMFSAWPSVFCWKKSELISRYILPSSTFLISCDRTHQRNVWRLNNQRIVSCDPGYKGIILFMHIVQLLWIWHTTIYHDVCWLHIWFFWCGNICFSTGVTVLWQNFVRPSLDVDISEDVSNW